MCPKIDYSREYTAAIVMAEETKLVSSVPVGARPMVIVRAIEHIGPDRIHNVCTLGMAYAEEPDITKFIGKYYRMFGAKCQRTRRQFNYPVASEDDALIQSIASHWTGHAVVCVPVQLMTVPQIGTQLMYVTGCFVGKDGKVITRFPDKPLCVHVPAMPSAAAGYYADVLRKYAVAAGVSRQTWTPSARTAMHVLVLDRNASEFHYVDDPDHVDDPSMLEMLYAAHGF